MNITTEIAEIVDMLTARVASYREAAARMAAAGYATQAADYAAWAVTAQADLDALVAA